MSAAEELWIYHDAASGLSSSSPTHGSCHTWKVRRNRLNMVRLATLVSTRESGPGAFGLMSTDVRACVCEYASTRSLPGDVERDNEQDMMSVPIQRVNLRVHQCPGSRGMFLFHVFFLRFVFKGISPQIPPCCTKTARFSMCLVCVCVKEREMALLTGFIFILNEENMIVRSAEFSKTLLQVFPHIKKRCFFITHIIRCNRKILWEFAPQWQ